jgi:hypothetical protein
MSVVRDGEANSPKHPAARSGERRVLGGDAKGAGGDSLEKVRKRAEDLGTPIEPNEADEMDVEFMQKQRQALKNVDEHPLAKAATKYTDGVQRWLKQHGELPNEAGEVIQWYQHFIYIKLCRALHGLIEEEEELRDENGEPFPKDSDGSAKVAIIAMERSMSAWSRARETHPRALEFMVELARLRAMAERVFPAARTFQRPGFDG